MPAKKTKKSAKKTSNLPARSVSGKHANRVRGGGKHIGNVKYGDVILKRGITT